MLFHSFASQAEKQEPHSRSVETVARQARQLSIDVKDIYILEDCSLTFKQREEELRAEALTYHESQRKLARKSDPKIVHTFAERRSQLVSLALNSLRSKLGSEKWGRIELFVRQSLKPSVQSWR